MPVFDEAPLRAVEFAPRALRPPGRRGPLAAGAWAVAIAALVGVGMLAGDPDADDGRPTLADAATADPAAEPAADDPWPPDLALPSTRMGALLLRQVIELESPAPGPVSVTTPRLDVAGTVLVRAARVQIALEARGNRVLDHVSVLVGDVNGGVRPESAPSFGASFELPFPRPNGTMWIVVTAYDERGMPLGATRRPFEVGPLVEPGAVRPDRHSLDGNWPWRPYGDFLLASPPPTCRPISPTLASSC